MKRRLPTLVLALALAGSARSAFAGGERLERWPRSLPPVDLELPEALPVAGALFGAVDRLPEQLHCAEQTILPRPAPTVARCRFPAAELRLRRPGAASVRLGFLLVVTDRDGEGGYHRDETALLPQIAGGRIVGLRNVFRLGHDHHWDRGAALLARRVRVVDLDRDGGDEVCIETLEVTLEPHRRERSREVAAFRHRDGALEPDPSLDRRCPPAGYRALVWAPPGGGVYRWEGATTRERRQLLRRGAARLGRPSE